MTTFGRYVLEQELGRGAMGVVYRGRDTVLERPVALKFLEPAGGGITPEQQERFRREARVAASLRHPNVVTIYELLEEGGRMAIVMELVDGTPLDVVLRRERRLPLATARRLAVQLLEGLAAAHGTGLVHRDIKPANLLVERGGRLKIVDFGIAKLPHDALTSHGVMFGTLGYVAPELYRGQAADQRSDLFAVGCLVYEIVTGTPAFAGGSLASVTHATLNTDPPFEASRWGGDAALAGLTAALLQKDPAARPPAARDALRLLCGAGTAGVPMPWEIPDVAPTPRHDVVGATVPFRADAHEMAPATGGTDPGRTAATAPAPAGSTATGAAPPIGTARRAPLALAGGLAVCLVTVIGLAWKLSATADSVSSIRSSGTAAGAPPAFEQPADLSATAGGVAAADSLVLPTSSSRLDRSERPPGGAGSPPRSPSVQPAATDADPPSSGLVIGTDEVTVSPEHLILVVEEQSQLRLEGPVGGSRQWKSSNPSVATVTPEGLVTAVGPGEAQVTVSTGGTEIAVPVTVKAGSSRAVAAVLSFAQLDSMVVEAVRNADVRALESALMRGGSARARTSDGTPVLVAAAQSGPVELVRWLQMCGAPTKGDVVERAIAVATDGVRRHLTATSASGIGVQRCGEQMRWR